MRSCFIDRALFEARFGLGARRLLTVASRLAGLETALSREAELRAQNLDVIGRDLASGPAVPRGVAEDVARCVADA